MTVASYILQLLSNEEYSFSVKELEKHCSKTKEAIKSELNRLVEKEEIINLRQDYYLILPPRYRSFHKLPIELFVDKMFSYLGKPYYVSCFSAARFHGAAHQQLQRDYIITGLPAIRSIEQPNNIKFLSASSWPVSNVEKRRSDAGYFNISSPSLTIADLIHYQSKLGGLSKQFTVIEELADELTNTDLEQLLEWYPNKSTFQRIGYLLEKLQVSDDLTSIIFSYLKKERYYPILLDHKKDQKAGKTGNRWKVDVNIQLESDL
ncbi:MAG: type IV toxin-antitoxin system AbiEi family antitoxin [Cyclobacteriaceae bacterium]|nr:type IV toxin-antitoxin system AbiEi family antitoxin [Cyclobacteriaceae bacterium]